ncbi:MAG: hypothetical protein IKF09_06065 [Clostridiales bacterium]|nr:hypothetical protein [Clostridiales bacterium]
MSESLDYIEENERIGPGILGALLFSLIGGVIWVILFWAGMFPGICGTACVVLAMIGYRLFSKKSSLKGVFIAVGAAVCIILIAIYFCLAIDAYRAINERYANGEYGHAVSFLNAVAYSYQFLTEPDIFLLLLKDFGWGMLFCAFGAFTFIVDGVKQHRLQKED